MRKNFIKILIIFTVLFLSILTLSAESLAESNANINHNSPKYKNIEEKIIAEGKARVIIVFEPDSQLQQKSRIKSLNSISVNDINSDETISEISGFDEHVKLSAIDGYAGTLTSEGLSELQAKGLHVKLYEDRLSYLHNDVQEGIHSGNSNEILYSTMTVSAAAVRANYSWDVLNVIGRNITVAMLDTGIDFTNTDLGGCFGNGTNASCKVFDGYDFYNRDGRPPMDTFNHGTFIAEILSGNGSIVKGIAPGSRLYALKVFDNNPVETFAADSDIIDAIYWAVNHNASIISLSLGSYNTDDVDFGTGKDLLSQTVDWAVSMGVVVVDSAGNSGNGASSINTPATAVKTITVGAVNDGNTVSTLNDFVWSGSDVGPGMFGRLDPEMVAPGYEIVSVIKGDQYGSAWTGTSMASPFVSGAAALLLEQNQQQHINLTPLQVRAILMQSAVNITGNLFVRGVGELDIQNALSGKVYATVHHTNTYGAIVDDDRWEFIITPYSTNYANITIFNNNNYNLSLTSTIDLLENMENNITLNSSQLKMPSIINVSSNSNITIQINFTLDNFDTTYATTYGGLIILNGSGYNGTAYVAKNIRIPVVITVPIRNFGYISRTLKDYPSDYQYCYYSTSQRSTSIYMNWSSINDWITLYVYNSTGDYLSNSNASGVNAQSVSISNTDNIKWFRIDGFQFSAPLTFNLNVSPASNSNPIITNISAIGGSILGTDPNSLLFYRPNNLTINISYSDADGDIVNVSINDSGYILINNYSNGTTGYATFRKIYTPDLLRNNSITISLMDPYGGISTQTINVLLFTTIIVHNYSPATSNIYLSQNGTMNFTIDASDTENKTLYYYWFLNSALNVSSESPSFIFNATPLLSNPYIINALISNNNTNNDINESQSWTVYIDRIVPGIVIQSPVSAPLNHSYIDINYTVSDPAPSSGINNCWYSINGTAYIINDSLENYSINYSINNSLGSCMNTSILIGNGIYTLRVYANDTVGNINYTDRAFVINDATSPSITVASSTPQGQQSSYVESVILTVYTDENATCRYSVDYDMNYSLMTGVFSDAITTHTVTYSTAGSSSIPVGYTIYVRCGDMSNNTDNVSTQIAFTIPAHHASSGGSSGSGSGDSSGGGGGGGGWSDAVMVAKDFDVLIAGQNNMSISSQNIPVSQVNVNMSEAGQNATLTVSVIDAPVVNPLDVMNDSIFSYLSINLTELYLQALRGTEIYFGVTQKWLHDNNITKGDVVMLRYNPSTTKWDKLPTELLNENEVSLYYVAHSPALGMFVISYNRALMNASLLEEQLINEASNETNPVSTANQASNVNQTYNNTHNATGVEKLHSENNNSKSGSGATSSSSNFHTIIENLMHDKENMWILWTLSGTFVFVIALLVVIKSSSKKQFEDELIRATKTEFKNANTELTKKVPKIPEDLEAIGEEVSRKLSAELSKSTNKPMTKQKETKELRKFKEFKESKEQKAMELKKKI